MNLRSLGLKKRVNSWRPREKKKKRLSRLTNVSQSLRRRSRSSRRKPKKKERMMRKVMEKKQSISMKKSFEKPLKERAPSGKRSTKQSVQQWTMMGKRSHLRSRSKSTRLNAPFSRRRIKRLT